MRTWIAEGRVAADALVWREGWRDWQTAGATFPQLAPGEAIPQVGAGARALGSAAAGSAGYRSAARRRSNATNAVIITALVLAVIVLALVFLWVLIEGPAPPSTEVAPKPLASRVAGVAPWAISPG